MSTSRRRAARYRRQGGFVMLEALIAIGILGFTLVLVNANLASGWRARQRGEMEANAVAIASAKLIEAGVTSPLREGLATGYEDGYAWQIEVARHLAPQETTTRSRVPAWRLNVEVTWQEVGGAPRQRTVNFSTIKLGSGAP